MTALQFRKPFLSANHLPGVQRDGTPSQPQRAEAQNNDEGAGSTEEKKMPGKNTEKGKS